MKTALVAALVLSAALFMTAQAQEAEPAFGQEAVELRAFRNGDVEAAANERQSVSTHSHSHAHGGAHDHGVESEIIFGFTLGSDTHPSGESKVAFETVGRLGKRSSHYVGIGQKLELAHAFTHDLSASVSLLSDYHKVHARSGYEADVEPVTARFMFNGFGGELRYRLLNRATSPFGLTLHVEPVVAVSDELSGIQGRKYGSENKIILDRTLVPDRWFAALNLLHDMEVVRERGTVAWSRGTNIGLALALTHQIAPNVFLGAETRYLRAYDGLSLATYSGNALYAGPTFTIAKNGAFASLAYNGLIGGHEKGLSNGLDLTHFERHQIRVKIGLHF